MMKKTNSLLSVLAVLALVIAFAPACGEAAGDGDGDGDGDSPDSGSTADAGLTDQFSVIYDSAAFQQCKGCHAPGAPGFTAGTEATQDWSTRATAFASLQMTATGLTGNFEDCNGVDFLGATSEQSLLVAVFDETVRTNYTNAGFPNCDADAISDMTLRVGALPPQLLTDLKAWVDAGAPNE